MTKRSKIRAWESFLQSLVACAVVFAVYVACADDEKEESTSSPVTETGSGSGSTQSTQTSQPAEAAGVLAQGASATAEGLKITITVIKDPFVSSNQFSKPDAGNRFVAYKLLLENGGTKEISASLLSCQITDSAGFQQDRASVVFDEQSLSDAPKLSAGGKFEGWAGFQVKEGNSVKELACKQFLGEKAVRFKVS